MRLRTPLLIAAATTALVGSFALPASAAPGDTAVTFAINGGSLSIAPAVGAELTAGAAGATTISGALGTVTVTDSRGGVLGWEVSAASTDFTRTGAGANSTSTAVTYTAGTVATGTSAGAVSVEAGAATELTTTAAPVLEAIDVSGNNVATWNPTLDVTMPAAALAGAYAGTVSTSIL
jgi:hypothetical protein